MKILLLSSLPANNAESILRPMLMVDRINKIYWVKSGDKVVVNDERIVVTRPPNIFTSTRKMSSSSYIPDIKSLFRTIYKFFLCLKIIRDNKCRLIVSVYFYPHGILGFLISRVTRTNWVHVSIAGYRETEMYGSKVKALVLKMLSYTDKLAVTGTRTKSALIDNHIEASQIVILPNTIDMGRISKKVSKRTFDILVLTRFYRVKRLDRLIKIISKVVNHIPNLRVCIAGRGPEKDKIRNLINENNLSKNILLLGNIKGRDVNRLWRKGKIFVLTSDGEGMPLTILEAMASGVVCISPDLGDISDIIKKDINGIILDDPDDYSKFSEMVISLLQNKPVLATLSQNSSKIKDLYDFKNNQDIWRHIIE